MNSDFKALIALNEEVKKDLSMFESMKIKSEKDFLSNQDSISLSIAILNKLSEISKGISKATVNFVAELRNIINPLISYCDNMVSKYGTVNAYKLYDFMTIDLPNLDKLLTELLNK